MAEGRFLKRALLLAKRGSGAVSPNPMVGCVIVKNGKIIGEGYHKKFGGAHAEVEAIAAAGESVAGADVYVNLEPCAHHGKTPPCADLLIEKKVARVVYGMKDPNPLVSGKGIQKLTSAGIAVEGPLLEETSRELNKSFVKYITTGLPYITLKIAASLDGRINADTGVQTQITSAASKKIVHKMRSSYDALLTGVSTVVVDDPRLNTRLVKGKTPKLVVLDSMLKTPHGARIFETHEKRDILIFCTMIASAERRVRLNNAGAEIIEVPAAADGTPDLNEVLSVLGKRNVASVMVEAGGKVNASFLKAGLADEIALFYAPEIYGTGDMLVHPDIYKKPFKLNFRISSVRRCGDDVFITLRKKETTAHVHGLG